MGALADLAGLMEDPTLVGVAGCHYRQGEHAGHLVGVFVVQALDDLRHEVCAGVDRSSGLGSVVEPALPLVDRADRRQVVDAGGQVVWTL